MPDLSGRELLSEWRSVMDSVIASATSVAGRSELPGELLRATQRQLELVQEIVDAEQRLRGGIVGGLLAPVEAVFDVLEESGATLRRQAETMESAGRALQDTAALMKVQAELFERLISIMRQPTGLARAAAQGVRRPRSGTAKDAKAAPHKRAAKGGRRT
jgi:hypothetical protein